MLFVHFVKGKQVLIRQFNLKIFQPDSRNEAGFYHTNRLPHPILASDRATEKAGAATKRVIIRLSQRGREPRRCQRADAHRTRPRAKRLNALPPKHLVARERNHDIRNPRPQTRGGRSCAAVMNHRRAAR
jgi:hypothetical protein